MNLFKIFLFFHAGDFHFLWECLKLIFDCYWGKTTCHGSLVSLRELISRTKVDKKVKTFCVGDEFLTRFSSTPFGSMLQAFNVTSSKAPIPHQFNRRWLEDTSKAIVEKVLLPLETPTYQQSFMYTSFLYLDLRQSIRFEEGKNIIRMWRLWLPYFLGTDRKNYSCEAANLV